MVMDNISDRLGRIELKLEALAGKENDSFKEVDLVECARLIWVQKWKVAVITAVFAITFAAISFSLPNVYRSEALLASALDESGGGVDGIASQFGGLANLAGVSLGSAKDEKTNIALETLTSRAFVFEFIQKHELLVPLLASKGWDPVKNELVYDSDIFNSETGEWSWKGVGEPTMQVAYKEFVRRLKVVQDKETKFVTVSFSFYSPNFAKKCVDLLVLGINDEIKRRDVLEARNSIRYLTEQLGATSVAGMRAVFYELIEDQTKTVMFSEARKEYVFKTLDPAIVPEEKYGPKRLLLIAAGILIGLVVAVSGVLVMFSGKNGK